MQSVLQYWHSWNVQYHCCNRAKFIMMYQFIIIHVNRCLNPKCGCKSIYKFILFISSCDYCRHDWIEVIKMWNMSHASHYIYYIEWIAVLIFSQVITSCIYVPPQSDGHYYLSLLGYFKSLSSSHNHIIIGDFNVSEVNWPTLSVSSIHPCNLLL